MRDDDDLLNEQDWEVWSEEPPPPPPKRDTSLGLPLMIVFAGVILMLILGIIDGWAMQRQPWSYALLYTEPLPIEDDENIVPVRLRRLPEPPSPLLSALEQTPQGMETIERFGLDRAEWVVLLPVTDAVLADLLTEGLIPSRGRFGALAGYLARGASFELDGHKFEVTGRIDRRVGGFGFAFVVPDHDAYRPLFDDEAGGIQGWVDIAGRARFPGLAGENGEHWPAPAGTVSKAGSGVPVGVILGMLVVALGGSLTYYRIFLRLAQRRVRGMQSMLEDIRDWPTLFLGMHLLLYGSFFVMMLLAIVYPLASMRLMNYVGHELTEGSLQHVGEAYGTGNILIAAAATFAHNFVVATLIGTFLVSIIPFGGVIKNLMTFLMVGFAMAPLWAGTATGMSFHSITMAIELGAYVVASFGVAVFWVRIGRGISNGNFNAAFNRALKTFGGAIYLSAVMLAIGAIYEAASLILLT